MNRKTQIFALPNDANGIGDKDERRGIGVILDIVGPKIDLELKREKSFKKLLAEEKKLLTFATLFGRNGDKNRKSRDNKTMTTSSGNDRRQVL